MIKNISTMPNNFGYVNFGNNQTTEFNKTNLFNVPAQQNTDCVAFSSNIQKPQEKESFFKKHWGKLLIGAGLGIGLAIFAHGKIQKKALEKITSRPENLTLKETMDDAAKASADLKLDIANKDSKDAMFLLNMSHPNNVKIKNSRNLRDDDKYVLINYQKADDGKSYFEKLIKIYQPNEVDKSLTDVIKDEPLLRIFAKKSKDQK